MKRGVWLAALAVGLGGFSDLAGQQAVWRPAARPADAPGAARVRPRDLPSATLGRPVAVTRGAFPAPGPAPRAFPSAYRGGASTGVTPPPGGVEPIATVPPPGSVIAASLPPTRILAPRDDAQDSGGDLFASDRVPVAIRFPMTTSAVVRAPE